LCPPRRHCLFRAPCTIGPLVPVALGGPGPSTSGPGSGSAFWSLGMMRVCAVTAWPTCAAVHACSPALPGSLPQWPLCQCFYVLFKCVRAQCAAPGVVQPGLPPGRCDCALVLVSVLSRSPCSVHWTHSVFLASTCHFFYFLLAEPSGWPLVPPFVLARLLHFCNRQVWPSIRRVPMIWPPCAIMIFLLYSIGHFEPFDFCFTEPTGWPLCATFRVLMIRPLGAIMNK